MSKRCIFPYNGVSVTETEAAIKPCCIYNEKARKKKLPFQLRSVPSIFDVDTLDDLHSLPQFKSIQKKLDRGIKVPQCQKCWIHEQSGITSKREESSRQYFFDKIEHGFVQDLEIALDFTCNMMCRMCTPLASSKWGTANAVLEQYKDNNIEAHFDSFDAKHYKKFQDQFYKVLDNTSFKHIKRIKIQGGEPFLAKHFEWLLDKIHNEAVDPSTVKVSIFSNGSIFPNKKILNKIENFDSGIVFSLDAYGDLATVIRYGVAWSDVEKTVHKWANWVKNNRTDLCTNTTLSLLNANMTDDLENFCESINIDINYNNLTTPRYLSMYQLPTVIRSQWKNSNRSKHFNDLLLADIKQQPDFERFLKATEILDAYQKVSFKQANPEMYDIVVSLQ